MESGSWKSEAVLGAFVLVVVVSFVWLAFQVGGSAPRGSQQYVLLLDSALGLSEDNTVAIAGVKVGVVDDIAVDGRLARVTIAIDPGVELKRDAKAALRAKTLLGEKYVDLDPGTAAGPPLPAGSVLEHNVPTVEIDKLIRDVSLLVDRVNAITPAVESAVARVDTLLEGKNGEDLQVQVADTLSDVRALINATNNLIAGSSDDVATLLALMRDRGPLLADRLESTSAHLDTLLEGVNPKAFEEAAVHIGPAAQSFDRVSQELSAAMGDVRAVAHRLDGVLMRFDSALARLDAVDENALREFLQLEGVRVNLIPNGQVNERMRRLKDDGAATPSPSPLVLPPAGPPGGPVR